MANKHDKHKPQASDTKQASTLIAFCSLVGLTTCFVAASIDKTSVPIYVFAIFGGGILGTDNILRILRTIFRINDD